MTALTMREVTKTRGEGPRAKQVLAGVRLTIEPGEFVILEGRSGSGKTTLLTLAAGLLTPDGGMIELAGERIDTMEPKRRRAVRARRVGFVFQRANLLEELTVAENVRLAAALAGFDSERAHEDAVRLLNSLEVGDLAHRAPSTLSGGEEHRVAVARALVHRPSIVFADEPTGNLDATSGLHVARALRRVAREQECAVLVATHDARLRDFADRIVHLDRGRIVEEGHA